MTPTDFLARAAELLEKHEGLRPRREVLSRRGDMILRDWLHRVTEGGESYWAWGSACGSITRDTCLSYDALAHIRSHWAEKVAEAGYWIGQRILYDSDVGEHRERFPSGRFWQAALISPDSDFLAETDTYLAALLAAVEKMVK